MNILVASSRGGGLAHHLPKSTIVEVMPGKTLNKLTERAISRLPPPHRLRETAHVYFLGGIPDISEKVESSTPLYHYRGIIYVEDCENTISRVQDEIRSCQSAILQQGAIPIFCTISKYNLETYNNSLLENNRTSFLYHSDHYSDMQTRLDHTIDKINDFIIRTNISNNMRTPCLHSAIMKRRGRAKHGYYIYAWHMLKDGLHATKELKELWANSIKVAFDKNRENDSDEENRSPKRSWRREKRLKKD